MASFQEIARRKFVGVPLIYWALAAVTVLAFVAWKLKPTVTGSGATGDATSDGDVGGEPGAGGDLSSLETTGTVVVQPQAISGVAATEETNDTWMRAAVNYLVSDAKLATVGDAQLAIATYLEGGDLTFDQGTLRDKAVMKLGLPPEGLPGVGKTGTAPAQKQFSNFPGKHTVRGPNDNTASKLAGLYYGSSDALHTNRIVEMNTGLGPASTSYSVGTVVSIPGYTNPAYYTVTGKNGDNYFSKIASTHGLTVAQLQALNPDLSQPVKTGTKVRTQ